MRQASTPLENCEICNPSPVDHGQESRNIRICEAELEEVSDQEREEHQTRRQLLTPSPLQTNENQTRSATLLRSGYVWRREKAVRRRGGKTKKKREGPKYVPNHSTSNTTVIAYQTYVPMRKKGVPVQRTVLESSPLLGSRSFTESPLYTWLVARKRNREETVHGGQSHNDRTRQPDSPTERDDRTKRQGRPQAQHTREQAPTNQGSRKLSPRLKSNTEAELPPLCVCFAVLPLV